MGLWEYNLDLSNWTISNRKFNCFNICKKIFNEMKWNENIVFSSCYVFRVRPAIGSRESGVGWIDISVCTYVALACVYTFSQSVAAVYITYNSVAYSRIEIFLSFSPSFGCPPIARNATTSNISRHSRRCCCCCS